MSFRRRVARGVGLLLVGQVFLAGALGDDHDRMPLVGDLFPDRREHAVLAVEREGHLGDQHEVRVALGEGAVAGDEAGVPTHHLHHADRRSGPTWPPRGPRGSTPTPPRRRSGSEAAVDERDVVVDGLRHADDGVLVAALLDHAGDLQRPAHGTVTAHDEQHVDVHHLEAVDDLLGVLLPAEVPRMVPPISSMPETESSVNSTTRALEARDDPW